MSGRTAIRLDAVLCALPAACCDNQVRGLGLGLPELWLPEDELAMAGCAWAMDARRAKASSKLNWTDHWRLIWKPRGHQ